MIPRPVAVLLWRALAILSLVVGFIGIFLPVLPTVPFVLLAAWAGSHGWPALERWLLDHAHFGPAIRRWRTSGAVPRRAKWAATVMMSVSGCWLALFSPLPGWVRVLVPLTMAGVAAWLWMRPEV